MMKPKLSKSQRTMLHNIVSGRPLLVGLTRNSISNGASSTVQALHRAGMLQGADNKPTAAGLAYFKT
jgi:hypothetical protein